MTATVGSFEDFAVIRPCRTIDAAFTVEMTSCGLLPKFANFTIDRDGFRLIAFQPCFWRSMIVNLNVKPYTARNGELAVKPRTRALFHHFVLSRFNSSYNLSGTLLSAAIERVHSFSLSLLPIIRNDGGALHCSPYGYRTVSCLHPETDFESVLHGTVFANGPFHDCCNCDLVGIFLCFVRVPSLLHELVLLLRALCTKLTHPAGTICSSAISNLAARTGSPGR